MSIIRVSDAQTSDYIEARMMRLQGDLRLLQEQLVSGRRLLRPEDDPLGAGEVVRASASLAALGRYRDGANLGVQMLHAQDDSLADATALLVRAEELATQHASALYGPAQRAAAREEVHGLLQELVAVANGSFAGRRLWSGLALEAPPPFADPATPGWTAATAFTGSTYEFEVKIGPDGGDRVRASTRGDTVFTAALQALETLETTLAGSTPVAPTLDGLAAARSGLASERASVGARQAQLQDRIGRVRGLELQEESSRAAVRDVDFAMAASRLAEAQTALQALLAAAAQIKESSLSSLLRL